MKLPNGSTVNVPKINGGIYLLSGSDTQGSPTPLFIPASGGLISFTNTAGADVGVISGAQITMPPALNWTNMSSIDTIIRSQGVTVNWSASTAYPGFVTIAGGSSSFNGSNTSNVVSTGFACTAPYSAGTFTVPSYVLQAMVTGSASVGGVSFPTGSLSLILNATPVKITAPSIDYATLNAGSITGKLVTYQ